ncbi:actin-related protein 2/3 complex subunit 1A-A-like isoform X2 [Lineus longissimus]|uniref:actin-related protein 2/3 complex subunit 1A-A-like isoform X2 n=1 Tax=Lineus longissimus TaxID=88925 RepID=UPI00315D1B5C
MSVHPFGSEPISCHAWNKDRSQVAISPNNHEVVIYKKRGSGWEKTDTLTEHTQRVTSIDWAPESNRLLTCGADRNAYVWTLVDGVWKPTLVILRINRAATVCKWSPLENKFAVGSGARLIAICFFEKDHDWWVSKHIKKPIRSTITSIDWHPDNCLILCGSSDFKARVFSTYVKELESKPKECCWGKKKSFGNLMAEFSNGGGGWVHDVSFSASGLKLAWVGHDSSLSVIDGGNGLQVATEKTKFLPFTTVLWVTENQLVVAGHDCCPMLFSHDGGKLTFLHQLDASKESESTGKVSAMKRFQDLDKKGRDADSAQFSYKHKNTITQLAIVGGDKNRVTQFSTSGVDGNICVWDFKTLESQIAGLRIC